MEEDVLVTYMMQLFREESWMPAGTLAKDELPSPVNKTTLLYISIFEVELPVRYGFDIIQLVQKAELIAESNSRVAILQWIKLAFFKYAEF